MAVLKNRAKMSTSTTGTGTITLGSAESGYQTFADAGVANADVVRYVIEDGSNFEIGTGTYTSSGTTLSRTVSESSNSDAAINLSGSATVFIGATAEDIPALYADNPSSATTPVASGANAVSIGTGAEASAVDGIAIGKDADATGSFRSIGIGRLAQAQQNSSIALGYSVLCNAPNGNALGNSAQVFTGTGATAIGNSYSSGAEAFAAGIANNGSSYGATGAGSIALGFRAKATTSSSIAIGQETLASGFDNSISIGWQNSATSSRSAAVIGGRGNASSGEYSTVIGGQGNTASGNHSISMGDGSTASHANSVSIGDSVQSTATNQINLGGTADTVRISETYTLPTTDGTNGQVLTTDGSGAVTFADAGGGGGADLYAANESSPSAQPSATGANAVAIGDGAISSGEDAISLGVSRATGNHSFAAAIAGNASHIGARGNYSIAMGYEADTGSSSQGAVAIGFEASAGANYAVSLGQSSATGSASFASAIANGSSSYGASGANSIAMGYQCKSTGANGVSLGQNNIVSGNNATAIGYFNTASGYYTTALGYDNTTSAAFGHAIGYQAVSSVNGKGAYASGAFSADGDAQGGMYILRADTTDATATVLTTNNSTAGSTNQIVAASDTCITFDGTITAMQDGAQAYASWKIEGLLVNDGGTTTLANSATTVIQNSSNWGMALSADNTNNALAITCTGEASHNIRWVANIRTTECTFA